MQLSAGALAQLLNGSVEGNPDVLVDRPCKIEEGEPGAISFLGNLKYEEYAYTTQASVLLVDRDFKAKSPIAATLVRVDNVYEAIQRLLQQFGQATQTAAIISKQAAIHDTAEIGQEVSIGDFAVLSEGVKVGLLVAHLAPEMPLEQRGLRGAGETRCDRPMLGPRPNRFPVRCRARPRRHACTGRPAAQRPAETPACLNA